MASKEPDNFIPRTADPYVEVMVEKKVSVPHVDGCTLVSHGIYIYAVIVDE